ncbi:hypothetical protein ES708_12373 [subsurface metagenome]
MNDYFNSSGSDKELEIACQVALRDSLKVNPGERVLIITNPHEDIALISMGLFDAALALGAEPALIHLDGLIKKPTIEVISAQYSKGSGIYIWSGYWLPPRWIAAPGFQHQ